ncbi:tetratricopeptide repeat protein [Ectothiorhodospira haloalkaliphila]|uniref:tetratricopeptide repeat-containing sulfotransferase family protein n=1 Tax=Ectothiorhodospira haloalkaliphila TaxID=421628 RepID=UPI001EE86CAB|nr:tetratricopeptide repeat-containing sulfotransferase family protein [Ectothiorhodospira haloalkaliphila]MCG5524766.1 tetratricopeptide repeat protein [Ectothiorhodospira haloalkaliphila]
MTSSTLQHAIEHHQAGRLAEAETGYRDHLQQHPDDPQAHYQLGLLALDTGHAEQSLGHFHAALQANPEQPRHWVGLARGLIHAQRLEDAREVLEEGQKLQILDDQIRPLLDQIAHHQQPHQEGASSSAAAPVDVLLQAAEAHFNKHELPQALDCAQQALRQAPDNARANLYLGSALAAQGRHEVAEPFLRRAVQHEPRNATAHSNLGVTLQALNKDKEALHHARKAAQLAPRIPAHHCNLASVLLDQKQYKKARDHARRALKLKPDYPEALNNLGNAYKHEGRLKEARKYYTQVNRTHPEYLPAHHNLADVHKSLGALDAAVEAYRRVLRVDPQRIESLNALSGLTTFTAPEDPCLQHLKARFDDANTPLRDRITAAFTLGKAMADLGDHETAFGYYAQGNQLKLPLATDDTDPQILLDAWRRVYDEAFLARVRQSDFGVAATPQILVVGMSRSGKSLVETLLAAHPEIQANGETRHLTHFVQARIAQQQAQVRLDYFAQLTPAQSRRDARAYQAKGGFRAGRRHVDTLPGNLHALGALALWLPRTPIIFCERDRQDLGVACYFKNYTEGHRYTYDLHALGRRIALTEAFMDFWQSVLPNPILRIRYEDLVSAPEATARCLYEFLGLEWQPEYLDRLESSAGRDYVAHLGLANSLDQPAPLRADLVGCAAPYAPWLEPLEAGYAAISPSDQAGAHPG